MNFLNDNFISEGLVWLMNTIQGVINEYSITIVIVTLLVRFVLIPLDIKQKRSTKRMQLLAPEVDGIKKRYANNPEQVNKRVQALYKQNKVSPMAGCIPMLIQLPLLFAFFGALRVIASEQTLNIILEATNVGAENVVLPSWLWVHNFWQPDSGMAAILPTAAEFNTFLVTNAHYISPQAFAILQSEGLVSFAGSAMTVAEAEYTALANEIIAANNLTGFANGWFGLPLIAGATLFFQQRLTSKNQMPTAQGSPGTGKFMLWFFPIFSIYICATSNAAFSVYWAVSNLYALGSYFMFERYYNAKYKKSTPEIIEKAEDVAKIEDKSEKSKSKG